MPIKVTIAERKDLQQLRDFQAKKRYWMRADIVLRADAGQSNLAIARRLGISRNTVKHWRSRFAREGLAGLKNRPIPGRPKSRIPGARPAIPTEPATAYAAAEVA